MTANTTGNSVKQEKIVKHMVSIFSFLLSEPPDSEKIDKRFEKSNCGSFDVFDPHFLYVHQCTYQRFTRFRKSSKCKVSRDNLLIVIRKRVFQQVLRFVFQAVLILVQDFVIFFSIIINLPNCC